MKKILSTLLAAGLIFSCSANTLAATVAMNEEPVKDEILNTIDEPTPEMMEEMIKRVRPLIDVPESYTEFNWDFHRNTYYSGSYWNFYWYDEEGTGELSVSCDTEGRITAYNLYSYDDYEKERKGVLPSVSPEELLPNAKKFMEKTAPYLSGIDLRLEEVQYPQVYYNHAYTYVFTRYENDIPVPENNVRIQVNHIFGNVVSFGANITVDTPFEKPEALIGDQKAMELLSEVQKMNLSYRLKTEYDDEGNLVERKAYLIYTPNLAYISVDAESGKIYTERNTWTAVKAPSLNGALGGVMMDSMASKEESAETEDGSFRYQLSEKELEQVALLESLITKDEATKVILNDSDLYIPENAYLSDATLSKRYFEPRPLTAVADSEQAENEKYVWNLYFSTPGEMYLGANAVVNAHDATLISYNADLPYTYHYEEYGVEEPTINYTKEDAIKIASDFIKKHESEKFENVVYSDSYDYSAIKYLENEDGTRLPVYRANRLTFVRQNEGIDFTYNSFNMGVDRATGKITRYSYTWYDDVTFESPKDAIGEKEALLSLYSYPGFGVNYEINSDYTYVDGYYNSVDAKIYARSVYSLYSPVTTTIRALDGKLVNYNNEEIDFTEESFEYTDISDHWAKETIKRFTYIGYGPTGDKFRPNEAITGMEFTELCESVRIYGYDEETVEKQSITRMDAVKLVIDYLGYGKIAVLKDVFITDFADNSDFVSEDVGYAAIARGFGLIEGDGENFRPYDTLTRAEALTIIENIIELEMLN